MADETTIAVYNQKVNDYHRMEEPLEHEKALIAFMATLPADGYVLDLGCGSGKSAAFLNRHGFKVDAVDASSCMVELANEEFGLNARQATFNDINEVDTYDGVWANFSLLHATAAEFPVFLKAIHTALKPSGSLHLGMKTGTGSQRDALGRFYTYYSEEKLKGMLNNNGFSIQHIQTGAGAGLAGTVDPWITILSTKT